MSEPPITVQAAHVSSGSNLPVRRIVIHSTCPDLGWPWASLKGTASGTAKYFSMQTSGGSAHYVEGIDREEHCVADDRIAWHAPPNPNSIGIEITSDGGDTGAFRVASHAYTREQWLSPQVLPILERAAARVAELCDRHGVPKVRINPAQVKAGAKGICGHVDVSDAFHQSTHSDPGPAFPWDHFMALVTGTVAPTPEDEVVTPDDIQKIAIEAADQTWNRFKVRGPNGTLIPLADALGLLLAQSNPTALAAAIAAKLPAGTAVSQAAIEAALKNVLGSLDGK